MHVPEVRVVFKESLLFLDGLVQGQVIVDVKLTPALDHHVAFLQRDHQVVDRVHHGQLCPFVDQVWLGQNAYGMTKDTEHQLS